MGGRTARMYREGKMLYPMLGTGASFAGFWLGVVVAYDLGLPVLAVAALGLVTGCAGASLIARLERWDNRG